jgi:hypothetical protein
MRHGCAALLLLVSSAAAASAQEQVLSPDLVVARLKTFDSNGDGRVATAELSERMQVIVTRGDTSGDGALDVSELRALALRRLEFVSEALQNRHSFGGYGFGDSAGLISTRSHIHNTLLSHRCSRRSSSASLNAR